MRQKELGQQQLLKRCVLKPTARLSFKKDRKKQALK
jgi:hypothetical protein